MKNLYISGSKSRGKVLKPKDFEDVKKAVRSKERLCGGCELPLKDNERYAHEACGADLLARYEV